MKEMRDMSDVQDKEKQKDKSDQVDMMKKMRDMSECLQDMKKQKEDPLLFPAKASHEMLEQMPRTVIIEAEFDFYLTETTREKHNVRIFPSS